MSHSCPAPVWTRPSPVLCPGSRRPTFVRQPGLQAPLSLCPLSGSRDCGQNCFLHLQDSWWPVSSRPAGESLTSRTSSQWVDCQIRWGPLKIISLLMNSKSTELGPPFLLPPIASVGCTGHTREEDFTGCAHQGAGIFGRGLLRIQPLQ